MIASFSVAKFTHGAECIRIDTHTNTLWCLRVANITRAPAWAREFLGRAHARASSSSSGYLSCVCVGNEMGNACTLSCAYVCERVRASMQTAHDANVCQTNEKLINLCRHSTHSHALARSWRGQFYTRVRLAENELRAMRCVCRCKAPARLARLKHSQFH